jgi:DNA-binding GntR family transcriptional regulator
MKTAALARIANGIARAEGRSDVPRYRQIIDALVRAIERGVLSPGDRLPPEIELAERFGVSPGTIQKALVYLAHRGFVERSRRRGTFVAGRQAEDVFVFRFKDPATGRILIPFTRVLSVTEDDSDGMWRTVLDADRCVRVERLVWVEGDSPAFSQFHIAIEHGRHLLDEPIDNLHGVSFHRILGRRFNLPTLRTTHRFQCRELCRTACRHLIVPEGTFGTVWDVIGFSHQQATTYQSLQIPAGHRPIEVDTAIIAPPVGRGADAVVDDAPRGKAAAVREPMQV